MYRKRPYRRRYRRRPRGTRKTLYRAVNKVVNRKLERKYLDKEDIHNPSTTGIIDSLTDTTLGTGDNANRIGDKISWNSLTIRGSIVGADDWNVVRIMLVQWKEDDQSDPITFGNVLEDTTRPWKSAYNHDYGFKFSVLYDRRFRVANNTAGQGNNLVNFMIRKKPRGRFMARTIKYVGSTVYGRGKLFLMMVTDSTAGSHPSIDYYSRLSYTDA